MSLTSLRTSVVMFRFCVSPCTCSKEEVLSKLRTDMELYRDILVKSMLIKLGIEEARDKLESALSKSLKREAAHFFKFVMEGAVEIHQFLAAMVRTFQEPKHWLGEYLRRADELNLPEENRAVVRKAQADPSRLEWLEDYLGRADELNLSEDDRALLREARAMPVILEVAEEQLSSEMKGLKESFDRMLESTTMHKKAEKERPGPKQKRDS